ncbi:hypothetical protein QFC24_004378 [Naganishia onofrii]|uniref:Uncharacterized protein n=1 Tax=Naganishia onofrii TaxID=1851511 RepID=A0ACC2XEW8_9TREE|nr:hypothetical protein QFC24_004378 [Naganishia onofrii]
MEKQEAFHVEEKVTPVGEHVEYLDSSSASLEASSINEKALIRKTDYRIVPWLSLLYLLSFLDRSNIGNANLFGLSKHLKLTQNEYSVCLAVFFAFYVLFEVPSNMCMKAWKPSKWLPLIMLAWGVVMVGMGFVKNFEGLLVARIFLGITEAGLFPGVSFYLTQWYRRYEINFRIALFFSAATAAGAFGGLLARLINEMDGVSGYHGWQWIFILEGIVTVVVAGASFWMLHDYPDTAKFLSADEKEFMKARLALDNDGCSQAFKYKFVKDAFLDWKVWVGSLMPVYCFSLFAPTLTANLGYTAAKAQLMSTPPYVLAAITTVAAGYMSDRLQKRGIVAIVFATIGALGFTLLIATKIPGVNYVGLHLAAAGVYPLIPVVVSWGSNNCGGSLKKGVATAIIVSVGNAGGVISSFIYPAKEKPRYYKGHGINIAYCVFVIFASAFMTWYLGNENKKKDARNAARTHPWTAEEKLEHEDRGDDVDWFRYVI